MLCPEVFFAIVLQTRYIAQNDLCSVLSFHKIWCSPLSLTVYVYMYIHTYILFSLFSIFMVYKLIINSEFANTEPLL